MNPLLSGDIELPGPDPDNEFDERQDPEVANISPDGSLDEQTEEPLRADDFKTIREKLMRHYPDLETAGEAVHTWEIRDWKHMQKKEHGPIFECAGQPWRVLFFPFGNQPNWASFYLEHGFEDKPPEDWYSCAIFMLVLWNPNDPTIFHYHEAHHRFNADEGDWGFTKFCELSKLMSSSWNKEGRPLVEDGAANMTAYVRVVKDPTGVLWHNFVNYDSKKETGMVGLRNQGATCYLNSLIQSLYFTNWFRKAVYQVPTDKNSNIEDNKAYTLQRLFYMLQRDTQPVSTHELTVSFGWNSREIFEQQDVHELCRKLMERLEEQMKGTEAEEALPTLFVGQQKTYLSCVNVDYESSSTQDFWDIQLHVFGTKNLDDCFAKLTAPEMLQGTEKYYAEGHGYQDATKGDIYTKFPDVLHLHLVRFNWDMESHAATKNNTRFEFPEVWDASPYLSKDADRSEPHIYHLHGVLVHSGDLNAGHYYAFIKPEKHGDFYKFDDDRVTRCTRKEALEDNFGGDLPAQPNGVTAQRNPYTRTWSRHRLQNAYMLVYIRECKLHRVLQPVGDELIPLHLEEKINEERKEQERRRKEREEAHLYMQVTVGTIENFNNYQGFDMFPSSRYSTEDYPAEAIPKTYKLLKKTLMPDFVKHVADDLGLDAELLRPWGLVGRQNSTVRPDMPIMWPELTLEEAAIRLTSRHPLKVWLEPGKRNESGEVEWVDMSQRKKQNEAKPIAIFLKHFDAEAQTLKGAGHIIINNDKKVADLVPHIIEQTGWQAETEVRLFEEIRAGMIELVNTKASFNQAELQDGDILCFQRALTEPEKTALLQAGKYTTPKELYDYMYHKVKISFYDRHDPTNEERQFTIELSTKMSYDQIATKVGEHINADPTYLRFATMYAGMNKFKSVVRRAVNQRLETILSGSAYTAFASGMSNQRQDALFYEILDIPLAELETKKALKIIMLTEGITNEEIIEILVPIQGTVADILAALQKKTNASDEAMANIRLCETQSGRISKELNPSHSTAGFNEYVTIYAEQTPEEERNADEKDRLINAYHFEKEPHKQHGVPFKFLIKPGEAFKDTKVRLAKRTGIKEKPFEKIKFAVVSRSMAARPEYLDDDDVLDEKIISPDLVLGLDHMNKTKNAWARSDVMMIR